MVETFYNIYLIELDVDEWGWGSFPGFGNILGIPIFYRLGEDGFPRGDPIDGAAWGPDTYENIANTMGPWLHQP